MSWRRLTLRDWWWLLRTAASAWLDDYAPSTDATGSLVVMLLWVYYSAQIFLLGAEFTWAYSGRFGSRSRQDFGPD